MRVRAEAGIRGQFCEVDEHSDRIASEFHTQGELGSRG
jgi:hypothetical protein